MRQFREHKKKEGSKEGEGVWPGEPSDLGGRGTPEDPYQIGEVVVKGHRKEREPAQGGLSLFPMPPLLPAGALVDEQGEPLKEDPKEKQEPEKKKEKEKKKPCKTTVEDLQKVFPKTKSKTLEEIADLVNKHGKDFGLDSKEKLQHFLFPIMGSKTKYAENVTLLKWLK